MTTENTATDTAAIIRHGWQIYRRASFLDWPEEKALDIARALAELHDQLFWYDRVCNSSGEDEDVSADDLEGRPEKYAAQASEAACRLTEIIRTACGLDL